MPHHKPLEWRGARLERGSIRIGTWSAAIAVAGVVGLLVAIDAGYVPLVDDAGSADVALVVRDPVHPIVRVENRSASIARDVQVQLMFWDLDARKDVGAADPGQLLVPLQPDDIGPRRSAGPWAIDSLSSALGPQANGHVIFGHGSINCPDCERREYWLCFRVGESGWIEELSGAEASNAPAVLSKILFAGNRYQQAIDEGIPPGQRIPIR